MPEDLLVEVLKALEAQGNDLLTKAQQRHDYGCDDRRIKSQSGQSEFFELDHFHAQEESSKNQIPEGRQKNSHPHGLWFHDIAEEIQRPLPQNQKTQGNQQQQNDDSQR